MREGPPRPGHPDTREGASPQPTRLDIYLENVRLIITTVQSGKVPLSEKSLQSWQALEAVSAALHADLTGIGPRLSSLDDETRKGYTDLLLTQPTEEMDPDSDDELFTLTSIMIGLRVREEMYPEMSRELWEEEVKPAMQDYGLSLEQIAKATGIDAEQLRAYDTGSIPVLDAQSLGRIRDALADHRDQNH